MTHISSAVVAQIVVKLFQRSGKVLITTTTDHIQPLARVSVIKTQPIYSCAVDSTPPCPSRGETRNKRISNKRKRPELLTSVDATEDDSLPFTVNCHTKPI